MEVNLKLNSRNCGQEIGVLISNVAALIWKQIGLLPVRIQAATVTIYMKVIPHRSCVLTLANIRSGSQPRRKFSKHICLSRKKLNFFCSSQSSQTHQTGAVTDSVKNSCFKIILYETVLLAGLLVSALSYKSRKTVEPAIPLSATQWTRPSKNAPICRRANGLCQLSTDGR